MFNTRLDSIQTNRAAAFALIELPLVGDSINLSASFGGSGLASTGAIVARHLEGVNFLFADGRVK